MCPLHLQRPGVDDIKKHKWYKVRWLGCATLIYVGNQGVKAQTIRTSVLFCLKQHGRHKQHWQHSWAEVLESHSAKGTDWDLLMARGVMSLDPPAAFEPACAWHARHHAPARVAG